MTHVPQTDLYTSWTTCFFIILGAEMGQLESPLILSSLFEDEKFTKATLNPRLIPSVKKSSSTYSKLCSQCGDMVGMLVTM